MYLQPENSTAMKKVLLTVATLTVLLTTGAFAQRYNYPQAPPVNTYPQQPGYNQPGYSQPGYNQPNYNQPGSGQSNYNYDYDDYQFDRHLDWWDRELNLSRRQERDIRRIRDRYAYQTRNVNPRDPRQRDFMRQARQQQFFDMMAVLQPDQRNRVIALMRPYERGSSWANRGQYHGNRNQPGYGPYGY